MGIAQLQRSAFQSRFVFFEKIFKPEPAKGIASYMQASNESAVGTKEEKEDRREEHL